MNLKKLNIFIIFYIVFILIAYKLTDFKLFNFLYYNIFDGSLNFIPEIGITKEKWDVHSVLLPEENIDFEKECERLNGIMDSHDCVNIFLSEGAGLQTIVNETEKEGGEILRDAYGHVRLDDLNPGQWFAKQFSKRLRANKVLVQKSGYFGRSSKANQKDLNLIFEFL